MKGLFEYLGGIIFTIALIIILVIAIPIVTTLFRPKIEVTVVEKYEEPSNLIVSMNAFLKATNDNGKSCRDMIIEELRGFGNHKSEIKDILKKMFTDKRAEINFGGTSINNDLEIIGNAEEIERTFVFPGKTTRKVVLRVWYG